MTLAESWDALADDVQAPPFLRPGWIHAWREAFAPGAPEPLTVHRGGELAGVLPLARKGRLTRGASNWHTPEFAPLARDDTAARELAAAAFDGARRVELAFLDPDRPPYRALEEEASSRGYRVLARTLERQPTLDLAGGLEPIEQRLGQKFVRDVRRRTRRLEEEHGTVTVTFEDGSSDLEALLEQGFRVEPSGWKTRTAIAAAPETHAFYTGVARWAAGRGWLRLAFLRAAGRAVAFQLALEQGGAYYFLKGGYDPAFDRYSPGKLLVNAAVRRAVETGLARFEFLGSADAWKLEWTDETRERRLFQAFAPTAAGHADRALYAYGRPLAKRISVVNRAVLALRR